MRACRAAAVAVGGAEVAHDVAAARRLADDDARRPPRRAGAAAAVAAAPAVAGGRLQSWPSAAEQFPPNVNAAHVPTLPPVGTVQAPVQQSVLEWQRRPAGRRTTRAGRCRRCRARAALGAGRTRVAERLARRVERGALAAGARVAAALAARGARRAVGAAAGNPQAPLLHAPLQHAPFEVLVAEGEAPAVAAEGVATVADVHGAAAAAASAAAPGAAAPALAAAAAAAAARRRISGAPVDAGRSLVSSARGEGGARDGHAEQGHRQNGRRAKRAIGPEKHGPFQPRGTEEHRESEGLSGLDPRALPATVTRPTSSRRRISPPPRRAPRGSRRRPRARRARARAARRARRARRSRAPPARCARARSPSPLATTTGASSPSFSS